MQKPSDQIKTLRPSKNRVPSLILSFTAALMLVLTSLNSAANAQTWPSKPIRVVVPAPAGSAPDIAARLIAEKLAPLWGQAVQIDNRPGAGGIIAMENVRGAAADGHTLVFAHAGAVLLTPKLLKAARYDPVVDFATLGLVVDAPMMIVTAADNPKPTAADLIAAAKADSGGVAMGSPEQSTLRYLVAHQLAQDTGVKFLHVPFGQPTMGIQALVKGDVKYYIDGIAPLLPHIASGRLKAVALTSERPLPGLETTPLLKNTVPGFAAVGWFALFGPKATPGDIAAQINHDLNQVLANDEVIKRMHSLSLFPNPKSPADSLAFIKSEVTRWAAVIDKLGLQPQ